MQRLITQATAELKSHPEYQARLTNSLLAESKSLTPEILHELKQEIKLTDQATIDRYFNQTRNFLDTPADAFIKDLRTLKTIEQREKFASLNTGFQFITGLGQNLKDEKLQRVGLIASSSLEIYSGFAALSTAATPLACAGPIGAIGLGALAVFSVFKKGKGGSESSVVTRHLNSISQQINSLHAEMQELGTAILNGQYVIYQSTKFLSQQVYDLHSDMRSLFDVNFKNQVVLLETINQGFSQLSVRVDRLEESILSTLNRVEVNLVRLTDIVKYGFDATLLMRFRELLNNVERTIEWSNGRPKSEIDSDRPRLFEMHGHLVNFLQFENGFASHPMHTGAIFFKGMGEGNQDEWILKILKDTSLAMMPELIGFLANYNKEFMAGKKGCLQIFSKSKPFNSFIHCDPELGSIEESKNIDLAAVFNPNIWLDGAEKYLDFVSRFKDYHQHFDSTYKHVDSIIHAGENFINFIKLIKKTYWHERLFAKYIDAINSILPAYSPAIWPEKVKILYSKLPFTAEDLNCNPAFLILKVVLTNESFKEHLQIIFNRIDAIVALMKAYGSLIGMSPELENKYINLLWSSDKIYKYLQSFISNAANERDFHLHPFNELIAEMGITKRFKNLPVSASRNEFAYNFTYCIGPLRRNHSSEVVVDPPHRYVESEIFSYIPKLVSSQCSGSFQLYVNAVSNMISQLRQLRGSFECSRIAEVVSVVESSPVATVMPAELKRVPEVKLSQIDDIKYDEKCEDIFKILTIYVNKLTDKDGEAKKQATNQLTLINALIDKLRSVIHEKQDPVEYIGLLQKLYDRFEKLDGILLFTSGYITEKMNRFLLGLSNEIKVAQKNLKSDASLQRTYSTVSPLLANSMMNRRDQSKRNTVGMVEYKSEARIS